MDPRRPLLPALLLLAACGGGKFNVQDIEAEVSPVIPTVVTVRWTTDEPTVGYVEYGDDETYGGQTPLESEATTDHEAVVMGLLPEVEVRFRVVIPDEEGETTSDPQTVTTGPLSNEAPQLDVEGGEHDEFTVVPILGAATGPAIFDRNGKAVWFYPDHRELDVYRARLARDGRSLLYNAASVSGDPADESVLVRVSLDGTEETATPVNLLAHDFVELPDGTIGAMVVEYRDVDGVPIRGDQIVEITPDGTQTVAWSAWDCFDPAVDIGTDQNIGWTFANALDYDEAADAYRISLRNFSTIVQIDRATRTCPIRFGTTAANVTPAPGDATFLHEHQSHWVDGSVLVFDNDGASGESRVTEFAWDGSAATADAVWSYTSEPSIYTFVLGDVTRLAGGDTMVDWAVGGQIDRVGPDGTLKWRVNTPMGYAFGFFNVMSTLYGGGTDADRIAAGE